MNNTIAMAKAAAFLIVLAACSGNDWPKTECAVPLAIGFGGMTDLEKPLPAVAVGGSVDLVPRCGTTGNEVLGLDFPYEVTTTGGSAVTAAKVGSYVELTGVSDGTVMLEIRHGDQIYATYPASAHVVDALAIAPAEKPTEAAPWVWAPGTHTFELAATSAGEPVFDQHASASFAPGVATGPRGFQIDVPAEGTYSLGAHAGTLDTTLAFTVSGTADSITAPGAPAQLDHLNSPVICFSALDRGSEILGLAWTFTIAGTPASNDGTCTIVTPSAADVGTTIDITGAAGGQSLTLSLPVI